MPRLVSALVCALCLAHPALGQDAAPSEYEPPRKLEEGQLQRPASKDETPTILKIILRPIKRGMLVRLPVIDTDPNRGVTYGVMPIWVIKEVGSDRIQHIHAPSLTYNETFGPIPTYRYYYYPDDNSSFMTRAAFSKQEERELLASFASEDFLRRGIELDLALQFNVDGAKRFYGFGPDSARLDEVNYIEDSLLYHASFGAPLVKDGDWKLHGSTHLEAFKAKEGRTPRLRDFDAVHPGVRPEHRQQTHEVGARLDYDTRDHAITTARGAYVNFGWSFSSRDFLSARDFTRSVFDARTFWPWLGDDERKITAAQLRYEQLLGDAPFWLLPTVGGKYSLRAYGSGRYYDRGSATLNVEERFTITSRKLAGVTTSFELAPFAGAGAVFDTPGKAESRHVRPVFGVAVRAVAKPQVVGSLDFGIGREGLKAFMDINYAF